MSLSVTLFSAICPELCNKVASGKETYSKHKFVVCSVTQFENGGNVVKFFIMELNKVQIKIIGFLRCWEGGKEERRGGGGEKEGRKRGGGEKGRRGGGENGRRGGGRKGKEDGEIIESTDSMLHVIPTVVTLPVTKQKIRWST